MRISKKFLALTLFTAIEAHANAALSQTPMKFVGLCEASGGAFIDAHRFAVASDETNVLRVFDLTKPEVTGVAVDLQEFIGADKSDLEAAARLGADVFWTSSHSFSKDGEDKEKRKRFFATFTDNSGHGMPVGAGLSIGNLRDGIVAVLGLGDAAAATARAQLNIEGPAAGEGNTLLIGLRGPLDGGKALVVPFLNPEAALGVKSQTIESAIFGPAIPLALNGDGIRDFARISPGEGSPYYLIIAGPIVDGPDFALWRWDGTVGHSAIQLGVQFGDLRPETLMQVPDTDNILALSDDGDVCSDETDAVGARSFRALVLTPADLGS